MLCDNFDDDELITIVHSKINKRPFISVEIAGQSFPAFLDTGSSISVIGDDVITVINDKNLTCKSKPKLIRFLKGEFMAEKSVTLSVDYEGGSRRHNFYLVPGTIRTVLLGRDFIGPAQISVHITEGGWSVGQNNAEIIPFLNYSNPLLKKNDDDHLCVNMHACK